MKAPADAHPLSTPDLRLQFIDWAKQHGHNPQTGAEAFVALQGEPATAADAAACEARREALCRELAALGEERDVAVQFPPVYRYAGVGGRAYRYSLMLVLAEDSVEWTARVWRGLDYQGVLTGRAQGPRANYAQLARRAVERELDRALPAYAEV